MLKKSVYSIGFLAVVLLIAFLFSPGCGGKKKSESVAFKSEAAPTDRFLFVGMIGSRAGLYLYEKDNEYPKRFYDVAGTTVIDLLSSKNNGVSFFATTTGYDKSRVFPVLQDIRLNIIDNKTLAYKEIASLGNALQIFTGFEDDKTYKIILNVLDLNAVNFVDQITMLFSVTGELIKTQKQRFDMQSTGYPQFPKSTLYTTSDNGLFAIAISGEKEFNYSFKDIAKEKGYHILKSPMRLKQIEWCNSDSIVIFSLLQMNNVKNRFDYSTPKTSGLYVYHVPVNRIPVKWEGGGFKNFRIIGNRLIFDNNFNRNSEILIYDLNLWKEVARIKVAGGCGLKSVPQLPDYRN